jgi:hypothetical protein
MASTKACPLLIACGVTKSEVVKVSQYLEKLSLLKNYLSIL